MDKIKTFNEFINESNIEDELKIGIEIEREHTDDESIARQIALDHLAEFPDYYTRLQKMEKEAKSEIEISETIKHEGEMWLVFDGKKLVGSYENRTDARDKDAEIRGKKKRKGAPIIKP